MSEARIHKAIVAVMREIGAIGKDAENVQQHYKYRSIEQVYNRVQPLFATHGIYSYPKVIESSRETHQTQKGGTLHYAVLTVEYTFAADDGSSIQVTVVGEGMDSGDKASNKAMTAAHKYAICQVLNIPYQVVDPDAHTPSWAAELNGRVTLRQLNDLKRAWAAKYAGDLKGQDKQTAKRFFTDWVRGRLGKQSQLGGALDIGDFRQWTADELERCTEALANVVNQGAEPARLEKGATEAAAEEAAAKTTTATGELF